MEEPLEDAIKHYIEDRQYVGLRQVCNHFHYYNKKRVKSALNGLCDEGILIFLGWNEGQEVYQKME